MYHLLDNYDGAYANVYKYYDSADSEIPVKVIKKNSNPGYNYWSLIAEYDILQLVNGSPYIIRLLDCVHNSKLPLPLQHPNNNRFDSFSLIFEAGDTNLVKWVSRYQSQYSLSRFNHIKRIMFDVALGLNQLHYSDIIHRDLKLCNILTFKQCNRCNYSNGQSCNQCQYRAKIIDFGLSIFESPLTLSNVSIPIYRSPECYSGERYDSKIDIWAYGICLQSVLTGLFSPVLAPTMSPDQLMTELVTHCIDDQASDAISLFFGNQYVTIYKKFSHNNLISTLYQSYGQTVPITELEQVSDLITNCLRFDPKKRFSIGEVYNHPWFSSLNEDVIVRPVKRDELPIITHHNPVRDTVMTLAQRLLDSLNNGFERRYGHRELTHGLRLFDQVNNYLIENNLESPSPSDDITALRPATRLSQVLAICIYISIKYFNPAREPDFRMSFKDLFGSPVSDESLSRLEYDIITKYLSLNIYHPSVYELSGGDQTIVNRALRLIMTDSKINGLTPSQVVDLVGAENYLSRSNEPTR